MRGLILLVSVLAVLVLPASAGAVELVNPDGSVAQPYQAWASRAKVPIVAERIEVRIGTCHLVNAVACTAPGRIELKQRCETFRSIRLRRACRVNFWHELGHRYHATMSIEDRAYIERIARDGSDLPFVPGYDEGEIFADSYARCQVGRIDFLGFFAVDTVGSSKQVRAICRMLRPELWQKKTPPANQRWRGFLSIPPSP